MLELKNINFSAGGQNILKDLSLKISTGKFIAITGPNGSGKSTIAKIIMGIEKPNNGQILFNGIDITNTSITERAKLGISFGFQAPVQFKGLTVLDLLNLSAGKKLDYSEARSYLYKVGLCGSKYLNREVDSSLSGGELKRVEIANVLARNAKLSIFDEPEAGIDLWSFNNLIQVFNDMRAEYKGSIIVISHQERILNIADEIVLIQDGSVNKKVRTSKDLDNASGLACCCQLKKGETA
ncbi:MAG: ATP-binding cassette domain-containing protein [Clostridia bacterium]